MGASRELKESFEWNNGHSLNVVVNLEQRQPEWVSRQWQSWFERYRCRGTIIHVHGLVRVDSPNAEFCHFCAFSEMFRRTHYCEGSNSHVPADYIALSEFVHSDVQSSMLVDPLQFIENPERVFLVFASFVMGLDRLDQLDGIRVYTANFRLFLPCVHWSLPKDRELRSLCCFSGERDRIGSCQLVGEVVKGGTQVMQEVTNKQSKLHDGKFSIGSQ